MLEILGKNLIHGFELKRKVRTVWHYYLQCVGFGQQLVDNSFGQNTYCNCKRQPLKNSIRVPAPAAEPYKRPFKICAVPLQWYIIFATFMRWQR